MIQGEREGDHGADHQEQCRDTADRERQRHHVEPDEAALLAFLVGHVKGVDDGLDAGIRAPDCEHKAKHEGRAQLGIALGDDARDLVADNLVGALRQHHGERLEIVANGLGIGEQAVKRDERGDGRKDREQTEEDDTGRCGEEAIVVDTGISPPEDVLPAGPGNRERVLRTTATAGLRGCIRRICLGGTGLRVAVILIRLRPVEATNIPLRGEHEHGRGGDQEPTVELSRSRRGHHVSNRWMGCFRRATVTPNSPAAATIKPS